MEDKAKEVLINLTLKTLGILSAFFAGYMLGLESGFFLALFLFVCSVFVVNVRVEVIPEEQEGSA